jgi:hypothetical protein
MPDSPPNGNRPNAVLRMKGEFLDLKLFGPQEILPLIKNIES